MRLLWSRRTKSTKILSFKPCNILKKKNSSQEFQNILNETFHNKMANIAMRIMHSTASTQVIEIAYIEHCILYKNTDLEQDMIICCNFDINAVNFNSSAFWL